MHFTEYCEKDLSNQYVYQSGSNILDECANFWPYLKLKLKFFKVFDVMSECLWKEFDTNEDLSMNWSKSNLKINRLAKQCQRSQRL